MNIRDYVLHGVCAHICCTTARGVRVVDSVGRIVRDKMLSKRKGGMLLLCCSCGLPVVLS